MGEIKPPVTEANCSASSPQPPSAGDRTDTRQNAESSSSRRMRSRHRNSDSEKGSRFDTDAADGAFMRDLQRSNRESTPGASPHRKRQRINGDRYVQQESRTALRLSTNNHRFIPSRSGQDLQASFSLLHEDGSPATPSKQKKRTPHGELHFQKSMLPKHPLCLSSC